MRTILPAIAVLRRWVCDCLRRIPYRVRSIWYTAGHWTIKLSPCLLLKHKKCLRLRSTRVHCLLVWEVATSVISQHKTEPPGTVVILRSVGTSNDPCGVIAEGTRLTRGHCAQNVLVRLSHTRLPSALSSSFLYIPQTNATHQGRTRQSYPWPHINGKRNGVLHITDKAEKASTFASCLSSFVLSFVGRQASFS